MLAPRTAADMKAARFDETLLACVGHDLTPECIPAEIANTFRACETIGDTGG